MECSTSCVMTGLKLTGRNERLLLLNQWYLQYAYQTLLSSKNVRMLDLEFLYGIRKEWKQSGAMELRLRLTADHLVLLLCVPSLLDHFPRHLLTLEEAGFDHYLLLTGFNQATGRFRAVDPITGFIGELSAEQLERASVKSDSLQYFMMQFPEDGTFAQPDLQTIFFHEAQQNLSLYLEQDKHTGSQALERFAQDLADCAHWQEGARTSFIRQNNITISSIVRMRELVWSSYRELGLMSAEHMEQGNSKAAAIAKNWMAVNFLLIKYSRQSGDSTVIDKITHKLTDIRHSELEFLQFIYAIGRELCES
jgi:hypothetical protein